MKKKDMDKLENAAKEFVASQQWTFECGKCGTTYVVGSGHVCPEMLKD